ncbi:cobalamin biosynthesis protein [Neotabrizicola sp. VNH66]|uniref:cobalamin biosynthesis protein n=1 Tax=Neotabrizicola sp. VNH66 TaxID=3400918 RepID=UPI003C06C9B6
MRVIGLGLSAAACSCMVEAALAAAGPADLLAILAMRAGHPALADLPLPVRWLPSSLLAGVTTPTQSARILLRFGCGSVAEAAALLASRGRLLLPRHTLGAVTWALAEGPGPSEGSNG